MVYSATSSQLRALDVNCGPLGVDGAQVRIFEKVNEVELRGLLCVVGDGPVMHNHNTSA